MKISLIIMFVLLSQVIFASPITFSENGTSFSIELISPERGERLRVLYEARYRYAFFMDSIEMEAFFGWDDDDDDGSEFDDEMEYFLEQISSISRGEYKVASIIMSVYDRKRYMFFGLMYFGYDYFFMVLFTNSFDQDFIDLRIHRRRYEDIFRSMRDMLF